MTMLLWTVLLAAGLLWPAHTLSPLDGAPLDGALEAVAIGVLVPALWWLDRAFVCKRVPQLLIAVLVALKVAGTLLPQEGLCAKFAMPAPVTGQVLTIPFDEPRGVLRSWDLRADWRADAPRCTAILDRPYASASAMPAWFTNAIDFIRPGRPDLVMTVNGTLSAGEPGTLSIETGTTMTIAGTIGGEAVNAAGGATIVRRLDAGHHAIDLQARMGGQDWRFDPRWNGASAFGGGRLTAGARTVPRPLSITMSLVTTAIVAVLIASWCAAALVRHQPGVPAIVWTAAATLLLGASAATGWIERLSPAVLIASAFVPVARPSRTIRVAFLLVGVPWLALFVIRSWPLIGHVSAYSADDWLAYQLAGYRIFMHGYWLEGGTATFDYQPLYRWISGALHMVFGDSSVGETYADAAALLGGALLVFTLVREAVGFRAGVAAAGAALATFSSGTIWYFAGRGLSETAAAGFAFLAAFALLRARSGEPAAAFSAGLWAVLMIYTRLNHLLFAFFLMPLMVPGEERSTFAGVRRFVAALPVRSCSIYAGTVAAGAALFAARTWWYTGVFSMLYGTSLKNNDTGLRFATLASAAPWRKVAHSLEALVWMNEPPHPDPRALLVAAGVLMAAAALCQVPRLRELPFGVALVTLGACASAFLVHTHNYPGRMSIHLVPFAIVSVAIGAARLRAPSPAFTAASRAPVPA